ncbi:MAG TPA: PAS domain S-box protein [Terriglobales bacterium]|nr:PAS domain S-box protein [Terriglobales bacterium]
MGDGVTRPAQSEELLRAKELKEALDRGAPPRLFPPADSARSLEEGSSEQAAIHQAFLERLVEFSPDAIAILDPDFCLRQINNKFTEIFGFRRKEALEQTLDSLVVPPDRMAEANWIRETVRQGQGVTLETKRRRKDGTVMDLLVSCVPVLAGGELVGAYVQCRDIQEQRNAEALSSALYRIAEKTSSAGDLQAFYAAAHNIVAELIYARNLYIALLDPGTQQLSFPYFVDEVDPAPGRKRMGRGLTEYVLRTSQPLLATPGVFQQLLEAGEVELIGAPSVDWLGVPLRVGTNTFGVLAVQSYDEGIRFGEREKEILRFVSQQVASAIDHKRNEEALRRSEARYRSLVHSAVYGIYRSSVEGTFLDVNPALITMLGYESAEEVLQLDAKKDVFLAPEEQIRLMDEYHEKGRLDGIEVRWKRRDETAITVRLSGRAVTAGDEPDKVLEIIAEDVTERRALEEQFRQAQKMEAVGRLAGGVAHDFNNLLLVVSGYTEVLLEALKPEHDLYPKAQAIQQAADRATTLTRQLLAFSRKQMLELKVVDLNAIVSDMERLLRPLIGENVELTTRLVPNVGPTRADAGQLEQVIMNLVVNAKDAMPAGGRITIQTSQVRFDEGARLEHRLVPPGDYVMLSVSDTGTGMDKETQSRIFEPFFTTKEKGKGTGLGLSTVYGIVKQSGGYIFANSSPGQGTTFRIYLPRVMDAAAHSGPVKAASAAGGGSETVLLVEDEESVRQLVRETLLARGYKVLEADNGEAGLRQVREQRGAIDIIITDVVMPGMSGRELATRVTADWPKIRVLFLSGYTEDAIIHDGVLEPGTAFLQKPFTLQALSRKVREILSGERMTN